ncbi:MAG: squalene cyclase [Nocardioides sp.]
MTPAVDDVIAWLLAGDPSIEWQTRRDLLGHAPADWQPVRARVESEGFGAALLAQQRPDGLWGGAGYFPDGFTRELFDQEGQPWTTTAHVLSDLWELGLDPASESARRTVDLVGRNGRWDAGDLPYWEGETEECINGQAVGYGSYFGVDMSRLVERLLTEQQDDGGWNCERPNGSVRGSFHSTISVVEGLLEFERAGRGSQASRAARARGEEYLLERRLFKRLSTGAPADEDFLKLTHPNRWYYDALRGLDHFRAAGELTGIRPDGRLGEALTWLESRRGTDGRWPLDIRPRGRAWIEVDDGPGRPSRWLTLRALRVLAWARS